MIPPSIHNGKWFVACHSRLGQIRRKGPVTGKEYLISPRGEWVDVEDAEEMVGNIEKFWCFKQNRYIEVIGIFNMEPAQNRLVEVL